MKQLNKTQSIIMLVGAILMVAGAGLYVLGAETGHKAAPCVFVPGTLMFVAMQTEQRYDGNDITLRRLRRIMLTGGAFFIISAVLMAENAYQVVYPYFLKAGINGYNAYLRYIHNNWVVSLLVAAVLQLYSTMRISSELKKHKPASNA